MDLHWNWCRSWTFFVVFGVFYFFTGWKAKNFVVAANVRGLVAKQSIISCYSCSILIIAMIWKFSTFSELILLNCFYKRSDNFRYSTEELYCLITSTREVILSLLLQEGSYCLVLLQKRCLSTHGHYTSGHILKLSYKWGCLLPGLPLSSKIVWVYIAWFTPT